MEGNNMKEMDCVEVIVEKEKYSRDGVHKGMQGWIGDPRNIDGCWLVDFPQCGEKDDIAMVPIHEKDMKEIPIMYAIVNEQIMAKFDALPPRKNDAGDDTGDNASYMA